MILQSSFERSKGGQAGNRKEKDMLAKRRETTVKMTVAALGFLAVVATGSWAFGQMPGGGRLYGPPPEAITACEGRSPGDAVQFHTPRGETITATCRLVAVPQE